MRINIRLFLVFGLAILLTACGGSADEPQAEPTLSTDDVVRTAEAIAEQTRSADTATPSPTQVLPTATVPVDTATPAPTATPSSARVVANYNANVRSGPDENYSAIDILESGKEAAIVGRFDGSPIGTWWFIRRIGQGLDGWIWNGAVTVVGNAAIVPPIDAPPTETKVPGATAVPSDTPEPTATP
jgi:hypothetical protein